jgi:hypothetical protein
MSHRLPIKSRNSSPNKLLLKIIPKESQSPAIFCENHSLSKIMAESSVPVSVLLVGSVPFASAKDVFLKASKELKGRLYALPDGETGQRGSFIAWQRAMFPPEALRLHVGGTPLPESGVPKLSLKDIKPTGYDEAAIASYAEFVQLKEEGQVPSEVRFQICLPTPFNCIQGLLKPELQAMIEPLYEKRFQETLDRITRTIPHNDLVIQWDLAYDIATLEHEGGRLTDPFYKAYFNPVRPALLERLSRLCQHIPADIHLGFHLCYGDRSHKHFLEPEDTGLLVGFANDIIATVAPSHTVEWIHMPVPRGRSDAAYFEPLKKLQLRGTRLYLGVVHALDESGTRRRIAAAQAAYPGQFGVATECGLGRTPVDEIESIFSICKNVTVPRDDIPRL